MNNNEQQDIESLKSDMKLLKTDLKKLGNDLLSHGNKKISSIQDGLQDKFKENHQLLEEKIARKPFAAVAIAFAVGAVFARVL